MHALPWQVPLDGQVVHGTAQVSWSHISGEALPVRLSEGMEVPAGSLNLDGLLLALLVLPNKRRQAVRHSVCTEWPMGVLLIAF